MDRHYSDDHDVRRRHHHCSARHRTSRRGGGGLEKKFRHRKNRILQVRERASFSRVLYITSPLLYFNCNTLTFVLAYFYESV